MCDGDSGGDGCGHDATDGDSDGFSWDGDAEPDRSGGGKVSFARLVVAITAVGAFAITVGYLESLGSSLH